MALIKNRIKQRAVQNRNVSKGIKHTINHHSCTFNDFGQICNGYLRRINFSYPKIISDSKYSSVIVENRLTINLEFTIRNTISKLPDDWSHTIICSPNNYGLVQSVANSISSQIRILKILPDNYSRNDYNNFCLSEDFYRLFENAEYLFIYQTDTFLFPRKIPQEIFEYNYTGAGWGYGDNEYLIKERLGVPEVVVGNGGLSLRNVPFCLRCLQNKGYQQFFSKLELAGLDKIPEDVFFAACAQIEGTLCPLDLALQFSHEPSGGFKTFLKINECSFGAHQIYAYFTNTYDLKQYLDYHFLPERKKNVFVWGNSDIQFEKVESEETLYVVVSFFKQYKKDIYYHSFCRYVAFLISRIDPAEFNECYKIEICQNNPYFKIEVFREDNSSLHTVKQIGFRPRNQFNYQNYIFSPIAKHENSILNNINNKYCINLKRRRDRRYWVQKEFDKIGLHDVSFFDAIEIAKKETYSISNPHMNFGEIGCFLSHVEVLKNAYVNNFENLLIIEDDCDFVNGANMVLQECLDKLPNDYDLVWIGGNERNKNHIHHINERVIVPNDYYGSHCLLFSRQGIKKAYDRLHNRSISMPIDIMYSRECNLVQYAFNVPIAMQAWSAGSIKEYIYHDSYNYTTFSPLNKT